MKHMVFALFGNAASVEAALTEVDGDDECRGRYSLIMHRDRLRSEELEVKESAWRAAARFGLVAGGAGGALLGGLFAGPLGLVGGGPLFAALVAGAGGSVLGALHGALAGTVIPDPHLRELAFGLEQGRILLSVETNSLKCQRRIEEILLRHGAHAAHRSLM